MPPGNAGQRGGWLRALGLLVVTGAFSVVHPGVLVAIPLALLAVFLTPRSAAVLILGLGGAALAFGGDPSSGIWFLERGWAVVLGGWFVALTLRWPGLGFVPRALGAVAGAFGVVGLHFSVRAGDWGLVDWTVTRHLDESAALALQALRATLPPASVTPSLEAQALEVMAVHALIFPALLGLASVSALGVAWWMHGRLTRNLEGEIGPLREFRFNDQLVWVLILGLLILLGSSGVLERIGTNAVVFMGGLYALRGLAVVVFMAGGISFLGGLLLAVGFFFLAPLFVGGAFLIGLGDTWLNLRGREGTQPLS